MDTTKSLTRKVSIFRFTMLGVLGIGLLSGAGRLADAAPPARNQGSHQDNQRRMPRDNGQVMLRLTEELNLTPAQQARIEPIVRSAAQQVRALRDNRSLSRQQKRERFQNIQTAAARRISAVLNAQQRKKFSVMVQQMHRHSAGPRP